MDLTRRQFVVRGTAGLSLVSLAGGAVPSLLQRASAADVAWKNRILVVLELTGGNDGLNTVIPFEDPAYHRARPELAISAQSHRLNDQFALHPAMEGVADLFKEGQVSIVHGVGYPQPNRSHFRSLEIWHTAQPETSAAKDGWLGRFLDGQTKDRTKLSGIAFADRLPQSMLASHANIAAVRELESYGIFVEGEEDVRLKRRMIQELATAEKDAKAASASLAFLERQVEDAYSGANQLRAAAAEYLPKGEYEGPLGRQLRMALQVIAADRGTRVIHVALDGFDTHANQRATHAELLGQVSVSVSQFLRELQTMGRADDVLVMTYSEFGRRVKENGSGGTDHGAAAPVLLFGNQLNAGFRGKHPSLDDLGDGDLKFTTDFRSLYATVLQDWLGTNATEILGEEFPVLPLLKA